MGKPRLERPGDQPGHTSTKWQCALHCVPTSRAEVKTSNRLGHHQRGVFPEAHHVARIGLSVSTIGSHRRGGRPCYYSPLTGEEAETQRG